ncbi:MAG TPA: hypothetical protein DCR24_05390 [Bacillus bacterium]|nr:hypothetical protein [Bacillus sp. (in: firmicutes)]
MKKFLLSIMVIFSGFLTIACSQEVEEEPQFLDVQLTINPEKGEVNEDISMEAKVTYGTEQVKDADEVKFEIWRANDEEHEKIVIDHSENGIYKLTKAFKEDGTYYVVAHVTARSMHYMPKKEFIIGKPSEPEGETNSSTHDMDEEENSGH